MQNDLRPSDSPRFASVRPSIPSRPPLAAPEIFVTAQRRWQSFDYAIPAAQETLELALYGAICLLVPFLLADQLLVGTLVNMGLVLAALNLRGLKLLPFVLLPSLGVLASTLIFGAATSHLLVLVPLIWVGNALLIGSIKRFGLGVGANRLSGLMVGIGAKVAWLFGGTLLLVSLGMVPTLFLTAMGAMQLASALCGGALALGVQTLKRQFF